MSNSTTAGVSTTTPTGGISTTQITTSAVVTTTSASSTFTTQIPSTTTSLVSASPTSTVIVGPTNTSPTVISVVSSLVVITPSSAGGTGEPTVITITSTQDPVTLTPAYSTSNSATSSSSTPTILGASSNGANGSGLSSSGKIAIAVIIPIVAIAALFGLGLFLWRKRKARKSAEEQRKDEMAEYGFNPNNDPNLVPVGAAYTDGGSEADDGYRGWGTTSSNPRKPSSGLGSGTKAPNGMAYSDTTSQPGNYNYQTSPNAGHSERWSGDPLVNGHPEGIDGIGALGGPAAVGGAAAMASYNNRANQGGIQRGPSNASSHYSHNPPQSETSSDTPGIASYYQEEVPYNIYNDVAPAHGPYGGDAAYTAPGTEQPVIRDVQARRNTRIERVPTFPQTQGGISQNF